MKIYLCFLLSCIFYISCADFLLHERIRAINDAGIVTITDKHYDSLAIIICDMWNYHWCATAHKRIESLAYVINRVLPIARKRGAHIIHAPSQCMEFYKNAAARINALSLCTSNKSTLSFPCEQYGICSCVNNECNVLTQYYERQTDIIKIENTDFISDNSQEILNILQHYKIKCVVICGVHLNMCIFGRPFGIQPMKNQGINIVVARDLVDSFFNPKFYEGISYQDGNDLNINFIEQHYCPSIDSIDLTGGNNSLSRERERERERGKSFLNLWQIAIYTAPLN